MKPHRDELFTTNAEDRKRAGLRRRRSRLVLGLFLVWLGLLGLVVLYALNLSP